MLVNRLPSGVVGRERMGTAFPHKKLSGNGVPTRETLRYLFIIASKLLLFSTVTMLQHSVHLNLNHVKIGHQDRFAKY